MNTITRPWSWALVLGQLELRAKATRRRLVLDDQPSQADRDHRIGFPIGALEEFAGARCVLRERDHVIVALAGGGGAGRGRGTRSSGSRVVSGRATAASSPGRGAKPRQLEWHLGDKVRVRAERIDPMRKRVEFALIP